MAEMNTTSVVPEVVVTNASENSFAVPEGCIVFRAVAVRDFIPWDNPDNIISFQAERAFDKAVVVSLYVLFFISAPTNIINMLVFYKQGLHERINVCLFSLAFVDFSYTAYMFVFHADRVGLDIADMTSRGVMAEIFMKNFMVGLYGLYFASAFISVVIACERCFCVVSPLKSQRILKTRTTAIIVVIGSLLNIGGFFVVGSRWDVKCFFDPKTGATSHSIYPRTFYLQNRQAIDTLDGLVYGLGLPVASGVTVTICTVVTIFKLRKMASWRESTSSGAMSAREMALTRMLVGTSILYIACNVGSLCFRLSIIAVPELSLTGRYYNLFNLTAGSTKFLSALNSSVNFFIYYAMGTKYRETVQNMFGRVTAKKKESDLSQSIASTKTDVE